MEKNKFSMEYAKQLQKDWHKAKEYGEKDMLRCKYVNYLKEHNEEYSKEFLKEWTDLQSEF
jgi:hypothetical protein